MKSRIKFLAVTIFFIVTIIASFVSCDQSSKTIAYKFDETYYYIENIIDKEGAIKVSDFNLEGKNPKFARHTKNLVLEKSKYKT